VFFVVRCDAAAMFDSIEETFDPVAVTGVETRRQASPNVRFQDALIGGLAAGLGRNSPSAFGREQRRKAVGPLSDAPERKTDIQPTAG
jgi:hypothetical protein